MSKSRLKNLQERFVAVGIDPTIDRWSEGVSHHPEVVKLIENAHEISCEYFEDYDTFSHGGDGDIGETIMYVLDLLFELRDKEKEKNVLR